MQETTDRKKEFRYIFSHHKPQDSKPSSVQISIYIYIYIVYMCVFLFIYNRSLSCDGALVYKQICMWLSICLGFIKISTKFIDHLDPPSCFKMAIPYIFQTEQKYTKNYKCKCISCTIVRLWQKDCRTFFGFPFILKKDWDIVI